MLKRAMWLLPVFLLVFGLRSVAVGQQAVLDVAPRPAGGETATAPGLSLTVDDAARVTALTVSERDVIGKAEPCPLVELADVTRGHEFVAGTRVDGALASGLTVSFDGLDANATVDCETTGEALRVSCNLVGREELPARGVLLRLNLPVDAISWRWHDDMQTVRDIGPSQVYENVRSLRAWPDLPEWADKPSLRIGAANRNFCTVLTGPVGLCLAVPLDRPCIFRTAYDPISRRLQLVYDLALSPDTDPPNQWSFQFVLYACDPEWGFRSALQRYYGLYPDFFKVHVNQPGMWMAFSPLSQIDNVNEFRFRFQEGAPETAYDDAIGVLDAPYLTHGGQFANIPEHDPEKDPLPPHGRLVEVMTGTFRRRTGSDQMYPAVGLYDREGKLDVTKTRVYGHIIAQFNIDPDLPYGAWTLDQADRRTERTREQSGGRLDGFYYDGLSQGLNYRTEHFRYSKAPPMWDPVAGKPVLNNFFSSCEFAKAAAERLRGQGQVTMMNGAFGASFYVAPWLDLFGGETGLRISREQMNYARTITWHKPMLTLLKGNFEQVRDHAQIELFHKRALAYGIFPGFFDWPPSGLGPGGRYWDHPEYYERDRSIFRKYQPLVQTLAGAGWEPVTHARSSFDGVFVERFGPGEDGIVWLTLLNDDAQPYATTLTIDSQAQGIDPEAVQCMDVVSGRAIDLRRKGGALVTDLDISADSVMMLQIASRRQAALWRLGECAETVELGMTMREIDADKPPVAFAWHPTGDGYTREPTDDGQALVLDGTDRGTQAAWQWAMLFQPKAAPVTIRMRVAAENVDGSGSLQLLTRPCWVSPGFTHRTTEQFDLPRGSYDWRDIRFTIQAEQPLRAIYLSLHMHENVSGRLKIASITIEDEFGDDYVENADFSRWYEPIPDNVEQRVAAGSRELFSAIQAASKAIAGGLDSDASRDSLLAIGSLTTQLREQIVAADAENGCRRVLRDVETVEQHLGHVLLDALDLPVPSLDVPETVAAGDRVPVRFTMEETGAVPLRTSIMVEGNAEITPTNEGATLNVSADAAAGETLRLIGQLTIGPEGKTASIRTIRMLRVTKPLEVSLASEGNDAESGALIVAVTMRNSRSVPLEARLTLTAPKGWKAPGSRTLTVPGRGEERRTVLIEPGEGAKAGSVEVVATATAGNVTERVARSMLHIPAEANLLRNAGFEDGLTSWSGHEEGTTEIDTTVARGGQASVRINNRSASQQSQVSQTITLNQQHPRPILVHAASRAENVSGGAGRGYSLYVDIYYTDGTALYGQTVNFNPGTHDWEIAEQVIEPQKPVRNVNVYLLLRGKSGTAWFDDVAVAEDTRN